MTPANRRSIRDLPPLETGGVIARTGFELQDHVAAGYCIDMLSSSALTEVWCERQDDVTLLWSDGSVEFVQVKSTDANWTANALIKDSILDKSLANDRAAEKSLFRMVTARGVDAALKVLTYEKQGHYRLGPEGQAKLADLEGRLKAIPSPNGNGLRYWLENTEWEVVQSIAFVENKNLLKLADAFERQGPPAPSNWVRTVYGQILDQVYAASKADWRAAKQPIRRADLLNWFAEQCKAAPRTAVPLWDIPAPTETFRERPEILAKIDEALATGKSTALTALKGMPGVGKSQMARRYAQSRRQQYDAGLWIVAETGNAIESALAALAPRLGVPPQPDPQATAAMVIEQFCNLHAKWLVVFDNASDAATVRPFVQRFHGDGHLLVTSRNEHVLQSSVSITSWPIPEATAFLLDRLGLGEESKADAEALATDLGGLILALEHAAAYLKSGDGSVTLADYRRMWQARLAKLPPGGHEYATAVEATILLSLDAVRAKSEDAWELLRLFAWLDPDFIPKRDFLEAGSAALPERLRGALADPDRWTELMWALRSHSLVGIEHREGQLGYTVHRVVQEVLRTWDPDGKGWWAALRVLDGAFPRGAYANVDCWPFCWRLLPQGRVLREWLRTGRVTGEAYLPVWNEVSSFLQPQGFFVEALGLQELSLAEAMKWRGEDNSEVAANRSNLSLILRDLGEYGKAREQIELALESAMRQLGPDHPEVAIRRSNLAIILQKLGEHCKAKKQIELALESDLRQFGLDHPNVAIRRSNLAVILQDLGERGKARDQMKLALESDLRQFGPDHPNVAIRRSNLAIILRDLGEHGKAREQIELALESDLRQFGPDHPNVSVHRSNLALILRDLREHGKAREQIELALQSALRQFGPDHPEVAIRRSNLAIILLDLGEHGRAREHIELALKSDLRQFGPDHPNVAVRRGNLATILYGLRDFEGAWEEINLAIANFEKSLPAGHPHTKDALSHRDIIARTRDRAKPKP